MNFSNLTTSCHTLLAWLVVSAVHANHDHCVWRRAYIHLTTKQPVMIDDNSFAKKNPDFAPIAKSLDNINDNLIKQAQKLMAVKINASHKKTAQSHDLGGFLSGF